MDINTGESTPEPIPIAGKLTYMYSEEEMGHWTTGIEPTDDDDDHHHHQSIDSNFKGTVVSRYSYDIIIIIYIVCYLFRNYILIIVKHCF